LSLKEEAAIRKQLASEQMYVLSTLLEKELLAPVGNNLRYRFFNRCPQSETNRVWL